jgi:hypothetical protein
MPLPRFLIHLFQLKRDIARLFCMTSTRPEKKEENKDVWGHGDPNLHDDWYGVLAEEDRVSRNSEASQKSKIFHLVLGRGKLP